MNNAVAKILSNKKHNLIAVIILLLLSLSMIFPAGIFNSSSQKEYVSSYLAEVAKKHTINSKYIGLSVEPKETSSKTINDSVSEFRFLYGKFREGLATYATTLNSKKERDAFILELDNSVVYSFLQNDHGFGNVSYNGHFKHEVYPLELMFRGEHISKVDREVLPNPSFKYSNFIYLSESQAKAIMPKKGIVYNEQDPIQSFSDLLGKYVTLNVNGSIKYFWIEDIYLEINYFYDALHEVIGEFLFCGGSLEKNFNREALFFLRDHTFQNKYYIDYSLSNYSIDDFKYEILTSNFVDGYCLDLGIVDFNFSDNNIVSIIFIIVSIGLALISLGLVGFAKFCIDWRYNLPVFISIFTPYLLFFVIFSFFRFDLLFSSFSTSWEIGTILVFTTIYIVLYLNSKSKRSI